MRGAARIFTAAAAAIMIAGCEARTVKLADGAWVVSAPKVANYGIVSGEFGTVVIDSGPGPIPGSELKKLAERLTMCEVTYLINTSADPKRVLGNQSFKHAEIVAHEGVWQEMTGRGESILRLMKQHPKAKALGAGEARLVPPTMTFDSRTTLRMPDRSIVVANPGGGPSPGASVVMLPDQKIIFAGDYLLVRMAPTIDEDTDILAWIASLDALTEAAKGYRVVPGVGETAGSESFRWMRDYLKELNESVTALAAGGASLEEVVKQVKMKNYRSWALHSKKISSNVEAVYRAATRPKGKEKE